MKTIKSLLTFGLSAVTALTITSCQDFDFMDEAEIKHDLTVNEYTKNFINHYGNIAPNQNWGFESMNAVKRTTLCSRAVDNGPTGATAGNVNDEANGWAAFQSDGNPVSNSLYPISIPGWPNIDGKYYSQNSSHQKSTIYDAAPSTSNEVMPAGDVTDFEILYVSNYFRTHTKQQMEEGGVMVKLHLTDFFIQNVSGDADQDEYRTPYGLGDNLDEILNQNCNFSMNHLLFKTVNGDDYSFENQSFNGWTHVNDFNSGATNKDPENNVNNNNVRVIKYITSSGTEDFAYHSDFSSDSKYFNDYVLVRLTWQEVGADNQTHWREGYYLAFNYEAYKDGARYNENCSADKYYSNWIIKITPATPQNIEEPKKYVKRVMCEDLGNTYDFDFNDVVFDVYFEERGDKCEAVINVLAAGGTMPIYVGVDPNSASNAEHYEAHHILGQNSSKVPVNVGGISHSASGNYRVSVPKSNDGTYNADDIVVYVKTNNGSVYSVAAANKGNLTNYNNGVKSTNDAPQKFAVPTSVKWMKECKFIETGYPQFKNWVNGTGSSEWYKTTGSEIYEYSVVSNQTSSTEQGEGNVSGQKFNVTLVNPSEGGTVTSTSALSNLTRGAYVSVSANPASGYTFSHWKIDGVEKTSETQATKSFMVLGNMTIEPVFVVSNQDITPTSNVNNSQYISVNGNVITIQSIYCTYTDNKLVIDKSYFAEMSNFNNVHARIQYNAANGYANFSFKGDNVWGNIGGDQYDTNGNLTLECDASYNNSIYDITKSNGLTLEINGPKPTSITITCENKANNTKRR